MLKEFYSLAGRLYIRTGAWICRLPALLGLMLISVASIAQPDPGSETDQPYCEVSSEQIVAGTSDQGAMLDTAGCTERLRRFVSKTVGEVRKSYGLLFEDLRADPHMVDTLSRLIAREELLSMGWASVFEGLISHAQSAADSRSLNEEQASVARAWYRECAEQREEQRTDNRTSVHDAPCTIIQF